jgi:cytochrome c2
MKPNGFFPLWVVVCLLALGCAASAAVIPGDAKAGAQVFTSEKCISCHSVQGQGGSTAPDLGKRGTGAFTPAEMAALMWNHAPQMWSAMEKSGIQKPKLSPDQAADLFAYFYAARYFEPPGDAGRGRKLFVSKGCSECHNITGSAADVGKPVMTWTSVADPIELSRVMWNHGTQMREAMSKKKVTVPQLTVAEMNDIIVYLRNLPQTKNLPPTFAPASAETGEMLFTAKGCQKCHQGAKSLAKRTTMRTVADMAAAMWNHSPQMGTTLPELRPEEMTRLAGYIWALQFDDHGGNADRGKKVFTEKGCAGCHNQVFPLKAPVSPYQIVSALWSHGPDMQKQMISKKVAWPRFDGSQMADLLTFANSAK